MVKRQETGYPTGFKTEQGPFSPGKPVFLTFNPVLSLCLKYGRKKFCPDEPVQVQSSGVKKPVREPVFWRQEVFGSL